MSLILLQAFFSFTLHPWGSTTFTQSSSFIFKHITAVSNLR